MVSGQQARSGKYKRQSAGVHTPGKQTVAHSSVLQVHIADMADKVSGMHQSASLMHPHEYNQPSWLMPQRQA